MHSKRLKDPGYDSYIISLDLSEGFLNSIYEAKGYKEFTHLDLYQSEHDEFLKKYGQLVNLHIGDSYFSKRLDVALRAVRSWTIE